MIVQRDTYIEKLWSRRHNGLIKIVTGMRRSGKSFLLFNLFVKQLKDNGYISEQRRFGRIRQRC